MKAEVVRYFKLLKQPKDALRLGVLAQVSQGNTKKVVMVSHSCDRGLAWILPSSIVVVSITLVVLEALPPTDRRRGSRSI